MGDIDREYRVLDTMGVSIVAVGRVGPVVGMNPLTQVRSRPTSFIELLVSARSSAADAPRPSRARIRGHR